MAALHHTAVEGLQPRMTVERSPRSAASRAKMQTVAVTLTAAFIEKVRSGIVPGEGYCSQVPIDVPLLLSDGN